MASPRTSSPVSRASARFSSSPATRLSPSGASPPGLSEIGRQLGVSYLLEGSVRRAGDRIRITAQLIEAASGAHLWAERYDRNLTEIFEVQDEVATMIVSTLVGRIEDATIRQSLRKPTVSLAAYDFLLRGIVHFRGYAADDNSRACAFFEKALACDPSYALAHSFLALARIALHGYGAAPADVKRASSATARRGVDLDPQEGGLPSHPRACSPLHPRVRRR